MECALYVLFVCFFWHNSSGHWKSPTEEIFWVQIEYESLDGTIPTRLIYLGVHTKPDGQFRWDHILHLFGTMYNSFLSKF